MKVEVVKLSKIKAGQIFQWDNHLFMKITPMPCGDFIFNAVELSTGETRIFLEQTKVSGPLRIRWFGKSKL
jgi:hypothetical protein